MSISNVLKRERKGPREIDGKDEVQKLQRKVK
jgi:hypothetical protein